MAPIQGEILELTVVGCNRLKDTEWVTRQDPYVVLEYGSTRHRTRTDTDGGRNPKFNEKYIFSLIEGLREINISVWNSNTISMDDFIGSGKVHLQRVLSEGYHDAAWPVTSRRGKTAGEVRIVMHYKKGAKVDQGATSSSPCHNSTNCYTQPPPPYYCPPYNAPYPPPPPIYQTPYPAPSAYATYPPPPPPTYAPSAPPATMPPSHHSFHPPPGYPTYGWPRGY